MQGVYHPTKMISLKREERKSRDGKYESNMAKTFPSSKK